MAQPKIAPGEVINLYSPRKDMPVDSTLALMKTTDMEAIRMVLPKGKEITEHSVDGEVSIQCLEGKTEFHTNGETHMLTSGDWLYLSRHQSHSFKVIRDTILLVTILFVQDGSDNDG